MSESVNYSHLSTASDLNLKDYITLLKPKVMTLVVFTGVASMISAPGFYDSHPFLIIMSVIALTLGSGAAGAINMWYDSDIDKVMKRTQSRPVPQGRIQRQDALTFGVFVSVASVLLMGLASNWVAAGILAFANFFYSVIYTMWLKRRTPQNIVIGGAAGAFPPLIGWAAVTGSVDIYPMIMFAIIFLWTPPHFWALALFSDTDYEKAGVPMLPVVAGRKATQVQMLIYTLLLLPVCLLPWILGYASNLYATGAVILNTLFILSSIRVFFDEKNTSAVRMFGYSIFYLFALFLLIILN